MGTTNIAVCFCYENQVPARKTAFATTRVLLKCCPMHKQSSQSVMWISMILLHQWRAEILWCPGDRLI